MTARVRTKGQRLKPTTRVFRQFDLNNPDDRRAFAAEQPSWDVELERQAWAILRDAGLPDRPGPILVRRNRRVGAKLDWRYPSKRDLADPTRWAAEWIGTHAIDLGDLELIPFDSAEGYASRILAGIEDARQRIADGDAKGAAELAARVAFLAGESRMVEWYSAQQRHADRLARPKTIALTVARDAWREDPKLRKVQVTHRINDALRCARERAVSRDTLNRWLREFVRDGKLTIPPQRRGRPPRK